ncbi:MAG: type II toxin-antitoxin system RelE/ParE family toxin [Bacteroidia bacterium]|nr:type II toxin-antitoxin system RelE/ParE family toxin [Bacteroidia bacterium]
MKQSVKRSNGLSNNLKETSLKALEKINEPYYSTIKEAIYSLAENPRPIGYKKLKGRDGCRIRVADYRIIYTILDDVLLVDVIAIGHRKEIYE